jgi:4'-phosphopantetheinyl transferase
VKWEPGPPDPRLADGALHVWRADLDAVSGEVTELLSADEHARGERTLSARKAQRWSRARGVLRELLGRYLEKDPGTLRFRTGAHGKPALAGGRAGHAAASDAASREHAWLSFNMSHSGELALYAFARSGAVGVDIEVGRRQFDAGAIAARAFGREEAMRLQGLQPDIREREFLRAWVRHEAALKCLGTGIGGRQVVTRGDEAGASGHAGRTSDEASDTSVESLSVAELDMGARGAAAVALEPAPLELRCWEWQSAPAVTRPPGHPR